MASWAKNQDDDRVMGDNKRSQALHILELDEHATWEQVECAYQRLMTRYSNGSLASYGLLRRTDRNKLLEAIAKAYMRLCQVRSSFVATAEASPIDKGTLDSRSETRGSKPPEPRDPATPGKMFKVPVESASVGHRSSVTTGAFSLGGGASEARVVPGSEPEKARSCESILVLSPEQEHDIREKQHTGLVLRQAREMRRLSVTELAQQLACSVRDLEQLESRGYECFASSRGLRTLVEKYADAVNLDQQPIVTEILSDYWNWRALQRKSR